MMPPHITISIQSGFSNRGSDNSRNRKRCHEILTTMVSNGFAIKRCSPLIDSPRVTVNDQDSPVPAGLTFVIEALFDHRAAQQTVTDALNATTAQLQASNDSAPSLRLSELPLTTPVSDRILARLRQDPALRAATQALRPDINLTQISGPSVPLWMAAVNATPDSFSDGGQLNRAADLDATISTLVNAGANIIDVGGESVRPGASPVTPAQEWTRIQPLLALLIERKKKDQLFPQICVDTRHAQVAERALDLGVDSINDVSGLSDADMRSVARNSRASFYVMHSLVIPPDPRHSLPESADALDIVSTWARTCHETCVREGIEPSRIILDPGICFGKTRAQSQYLMQSISILRAQGHRILVGHSRKGFSREVEKLPVTQRDPATVTASLAMANQGVDVLRVHNVQLHTERFRSRSLHPPV